MAIEIKKRNKQIILIYKPDRQDTSFIEDSFRDKGFFFLKRIFYFEKSDVLEHDDFKYVFLLGELKDNYYKICSKILEMNHNLFIHKDIDVKNKTFFSLCRGRNFSVFFELSKILKRDVVIGGSQKDAIPESVFYELLKCIPNDYEVDMYIDARFSSVVGTVFEGGIDDFLGKYETFTQKKIDKLKNVLAKPEANFGGDELKHYEIVKYEGIKNTIQQWLADPVGAHSEADWQHLINNIILLLFPKYIKVFDEAPVEDPYKVTKTGRKSIRRLDYLLVDADGNCDIAEIKSPFENCILSKNLYRDNYVPHHELCGAIMQVEKYIFYISKKGMAADKKLNDKYKNDLPQNFEIKITNPKGLVILGRSNQFDKRQRRDFEIIKRKYQHVMDILSYDDILTRLENIISMLKK